MRGEFAEAERSYRAAHEAGREPQPGIALLRLAQGRVDAADATIRRALGEAEDPITRAWMLGPFVEIAVAVGDVEAARVAADELAILADQPEPAVPPCPCGTHVRRGAHG